MFWIWEPHLGEPVHTDKSWLSIVWVGGKGQEGISLGHPGSIQTCYGGSQSLCHWWFLFLLKVNTTSPESFSCVKRLPVGLSCVFISEMTEDIPTNSIPHQLLAISPQHYLLDWFFVHVVDVFWFYFYFIFIFLQFISLHFDKYSTDPGFTE